MNSIESKDKNFAQNRVATQKRVTPTTSHEVPEEPYSHEWAMRRLFLCKSAEWLSQEDILSYLRENHGRTPSEGTFRNIITTLKADYIETRRSTFAEYRLKPICATTQHEVHSTAIGSRGKSGVRELRLDLVDFLLSLPFEELGVHNVRCWTAVDSLGFCRESDGWKPYPKKTLYQKEVELDGLRFILQGRYGKGKSLMVLTRCANSPIVYDAGSLIRFNSILCELRARFCCDEGVPQVESWTVVYWERGRDAKAPIRGLNFELCYKDWFGNMVRAYSRHDGRVRVEQLETPRVKVGALITNYMESVGVSGSAASMLVSMAGQIQRQESCIRDLESRVFVSSGP